MHSYDVVIIGGGHNGLTCAAYLGMAGLKVKVLERRPVVGRRGGHRGVSSGLSQLGRRLHGEPAQSEDHRRSSPRRARAAHRRAPRAEFPARRSMGPISSRPKGGPSARSRNSARATPSAMARSIASSTRRPTCCASSCLQAPPNLDARLYASARSANCSRPAASATGCAGCRTTNLARRLRPLHQIRRRLSRRLVRGRPRQGAARLRCDRRELRQPLRRPAPPTCCCITRSAR